MHHIAIGIVIAMIFVSIVASFCVVLIRLYFSRIKSYTAQLYQKDLDHQKSLNTAIMETQEQVLHNISQDLHDDAGQQLTYINFQLENLKLDSAHMSGALEPVSESVRQLSDTVRGISHALNNQLLTQQDLVRAIETEMLRLQKNARIHFVFSVDGKPEDPFSVDEKVVIYRIFQESVNNILKHASATRVDVHISFNPVFALHISDNGHGFDLRQLPTDATLGLKNMANRAGIIGYQLDTISAPDKGTTITLTKTENHGKDKHRNHRRS